MRFLQDRRSGTGSCRSPSTRGCTGTAARARRAAGTSRRRCSCCFAQVARRRRTLWRSGMLMQLTSAGSVKLDVLVVVVRSSTSTGPRPARRSTSRSTSSLGRRGAGGDADASRRRASQARSTSASSSTRYARRALALGDLDQAERVRGVRRADDEHEVGTRARRRAPPAGGSWSRSRCRRVRGPRSCGKRSRRRRRPRSVSSTASVVCVR